MKTVEFKGEELTIHPIRYQNGNHGLVATVDNLPFMMITVNTKLRIPDRTVLVKNYSENKGIFEALAAAGIVSLLEEDYIQDGIYWCSI